MARRRPTEPTANPARGAVLVAVAVVIGLFLLRNGIDSSTTVSDDRGDTEADAGTDLGATDEGDSTSTSTPAARTPDQVRVIVLNDSGVTGAAGRYSEAIGAAGYVLANPEGDTSTLPGDAPATRVLYTDTFEQEAVVLADALGAPETGVEALGTAVPGPIGDANVIVVLGTDLANVDPAIPPA